MKFYILQASIGVKGSVQSRIIEKNDKKENVMEIIAEKVTFFK